jgi:hypothetical protein
MYYRYYHYPMHHRVQPHYGVRTERYKLIYFNKIGQWELPGQGSVSRINGLEP